MKYDNLFIIGEHEVFLCVKKVRSTLKLRTLRLIFADKKILVTDFLR